MDKTSYGVPISKVDLDFLGVRHLPILAYNYSHDESVVRSIIDYEPKMKPFLLDTEDLPLNLVQEFLEEYDNPIKDDEGRLTYPPLPNLSTFLKRTDLDMEYIEELIVTSESEKLKVTLLQHKGLHPTFLGERLLMNVSMAQKDTIAANPSTPFRFLYQALTASESYSFFSVLNNPSLNDYEYEELLKIIIVVGGHSIENINPNIFRSESTPSWVLHNLTLNENIVAKCLAAGHKNTTLEDLEILVQEMSYSVMSDKEKSYLFQNLISNPSLPGASLQKVHSLFPESGAMHFIGMHNNLTPDLLEFLMSQYEEGINPDMVPYSTTQRLTARNPNLSSDMIKRLGTPQTLETVYSIMRHESCTEDVSEWILDEMEGSLEGRQETAYWLKYESLFNKFSADEPEEVLKALIINPRTPETFIADIIFENQGTPIAQLAVKLKGFKGILLEIEDRIPKSNENPFTPEVIVDIWENNRNNNLRFINPVKVI